MLEISPTKKDVFLVFFVGFVLFYFVFVFV